MTNRNQTKKDRQGTKKRAEREARIRAAKRRRVQRLSMVVGLLAAAVIAGVVLSQGGTDAGGSFDAGGGENCGDAAPEATVEPGGAYDHAPDMQIDCTLDYTATIMTNQGEVVIKLFDNAAPVTVNNFVALSRDGFYDGLTFHRVIKDFMLQGGDPAGDGSGGPGYKFQDEFDEDKTFELPYRLAMANSGANTNGSQFFITVAPTIHLNGKHTIFGVVEEGSDIVDKISLLPVGEGDVPVDPVIIESIKITESAGASSSPSAEPSSSPSSSPSAEPSPTQSSTS